MDPNVCADNRTGADINTRKARAQQASTALDRKKNLRIRKLVGEVPAAFAPAWILEVRKAATWPFSDTPHT
jgi:hypothetical protein